MADDLDESVGSTLEARAAAVAASGRAAAGSAGDPEDGFAQRLAADGRVLDRTGAPATGALTPAELARAAAGDDVEAEREVEGVDGTARLLAERHGSEVVVVGQSLDDRDETLAALAGAFALGAPVAALVVALLGYGLAAVSLRPVERMRRRAEDVSLEGGPEALPLPAARDEIRRLGETLNTMLDRLRGSYERERRFVADASHELRTPVAVIKAELESALRRAPADPELREPLAAAVDECDRLAQLAEDLLVLARSGDGALAVRPRRIDAAELLEHVRTRFAARAAERGRELRVDAAPGLARRRRRAAALAGARQPRRQRAAPRRGRDHAQRPPRRAPPSSSRSPTRATGVPPELAGPRIRALRPRRRGAHARRRRARAGDRACDRRGPRRRRGAGRRRPRRGPAAVSGRSKLATVRCPHANARRYDMKDKLKGVLIATGVIAVLATGGAAIAGATGGGDGGDKGEKETPITGSALDRASQVALEEVGGGKVTQTEAGDEEGAYEVEVTKADGSQVDVHLDKSFAVIDAKADHEDADGPGDE